MDGEFSLAQPQLHVLGVSDHARLLSPDVPITIFAIDRLSLFVFPEHVSYYNKRTIRGQPLIVCSVSVDLCGDFIIAKINTHFRYRCMKDYNIIRLREDIKNRCSRV